MTLAMHIFVYGTLRAGEINDITRAAARHDHAAPTLVGTARVTGALYDFGDYPGLVLDAAARAVAGEVYHIEPQLLPVLDGIEEYVPNRISLFYRTEIPVHVEGKNLTCLVYPVRARDTQAMACIACDDWVLHRQLRGA